LLNPGQVVEVAERFQDTDPCGQIVLIACEPRALDPSPSGIRQGVRLIEQRDHTRQDGCVSAGHTQPPQRLSLEDAQAPRMRELGDSLQRAGLGRDPAIRQQREQAFEAF